MADINSSDLVGGGKSVLINGVVTLNRYDDNPTINGMEFLKSGVVNSSTSSYPDATLSKVDQYTGSSFVTSGQDSAPIGIKSVSNSYWVAGTVTNRVYEYNSSGVYTGVNINPSSQSSSTVDVTHDGTNFWVLDNSNGVVYEYDGTTRAYTGNSFSVNSEAADPTGIDYDGVNFWVLDRTTEEVYKYTSAGVYTGTNFDTSGETTDPFGLAVANSLVYITDTNGAQTTVYEYTAAGGYTGNSINTSAQIASSHFSRGLTFDGVNFVVTEDSLSTVTLNAYKYTLTDVVGLQTASTDTDTGLPIYTRIK